ncbi:hypothetical protein TDB9533_01593 [Thalassocella blandensis]|nr:hypothetical protein TDB9533_01593 [Thalassocella blandensis]
MKFAIKTNVKRLFPQVALQWRAYHRLIRNPDSYLYLSGWMDSLHKGKPMDHAGNLIPWLNFGFVNFLNDRLQKDLTLFEFGSGFSTHYYAARVLQVTSVEHEKCWYDHVNKDMPANVTLLYRALDKNGDYCQSIHHVKQSYDLVMVDGRDRVNCLKQSVNALTPRGVVLLDDSQRDKYQEGITFMQQQGFRILHFEGMKPKGTGMSRTTVFYRKENCLGI